MRSDSTVLNIFDPAVTSVQDDEIGSGFAVEDQCHAEAVESFQAGDSVLNHLQLVMQLVRFQWGEKGSDAVANPAHLVWGEIFMGGRFMGMIFMTRIKMLSFFCF